MELLLIGLGVGFVLGTVFGVWLSVKVTVIRQTVVHHCEDVGGSG